MGRDRKLDQVIVALIRQIRAPHIIDLHPPTPVEEAIEHLFPLGEAENAACKKVPAAQNVFIFRQQRRPKHRLILTGETGPDDFPSGASAAKERSDQDVGVDHNCRHGEVIAYMPSKSNLPREAGAARIADSPPVRQSASRGYGRLADPMKGSCGWGADIRAVDPRDLRRQGSACATPAFFCCHH